MNASVLQQQKVEVLLAAHAWSFCGLLKSKFQPSLSLIWGHDNALNARLNKYFH